MDEPALARRLRRALGVEAELVADARAPEVGDAQARPRTTSGNVNGAWKAQCDSAQSPITGPRLMSSPPSRISHSLITVSKKA